MEVTPETTVASAAAWYRGRGWKSLVGVELKAFRAHLSWHNSISFLEGNFCLPRAVSVVLRPELHYSRTKTLSDTISPTLKNLFLISGNPALLTTSLRLFIPSLNTRYSLFLSKVDFDVLWFSGPELVGHKSHFPFSCERGGLKSSKPLRRWRELAKFVFFVQCSSEW